MHPSIYPTCEKYSGTNFKKFHPRVNAYPPSQKISQRGVFLKYRVIGTREQLTTVLKRCLKQVDKYIWLILYGFNKGCKTRDAAVDKMACNVVERRSCSRRNAEITRARFSLHKLIFTTELVEHIDTQRKFFVLPSIRAK